MTSIAVRTVAEGAAPDASAHVLHLLGAMPARGTARVQWADDVIALAGASHDWEPGAADPAHLLARAGPITVVADATLYYVDDLVQRVEAGASRRSAADLILAAYSVAGDALTEFLEGDYAFVIWDGRRRRLLAARDFGGKRPLYFSAYGNAVTIASSVSGVIADDRVPRDFDLGSIAAVAAGLWCHEDATCYSAVKELRGGYCLSWEQNGPCVVRRFWREPGSILSRANGDASPELRHLLTRATAERMTPGGVTGVTLSGGWDSTSVYGSGNHAIRSGSHTGSLAPISLSYPPGDPGYEDDFIAETAAFWGTEPRWISAYDNPMFPDIDASARERDEPWAHPFEFGNRALYRTARAAGAHVVLDGFGGDQLFQVSDVYLADVLRSRHLLGFLRQWRTRSSRGARMFFRNAVRPRLSARTVRMIARLRGMGEPRHYLDRQPPPWFRHRFLREHRVFERELASRPPLATHSAVLAETHAYLLYPGFPRMSGRVAAFALSEGVELRSPLLDARVVRFAAERPWYERVDGGETKILLRQAMRGLLPDRLLAPRTQRTGVTARYFVQRMTEAGRAYVDDIVSESRLADLGMIDPAHLKRAWDYFVSSSDTEIGARIYYTIQAERWLRVRT